MNNFDEGTNFFRGCLIALLLSLGLWAGLIWGVVLLVRFAGL